jgi:hypothetical protein
MYMSTSSLQPLAQSVVGNPLMSSSVSANGVGSVQPLMLDLLQELRKTKVS